MIKKLLYCFAAFFLGYILLRILPLPFSYIQNLTSFFSMLVALAAIYTVVKHALKEQIDQAGERHNKEKIKSLSWAVYPSLADFSRLLIDLDAQEGLFLYDKAKKAQELLQDKFTDTAKHWFIDDLLVYYEYVAERSALPDFARASENIAQLDYIDKEKRLLLLQEFSKLAKLHKEYVFVRQTSAIGRMSTQYYKNYAIIASYDKKELEELIVNIISQIEEYLEINEMQIKEIEVSGE